MSTNAADLFVAAERLDESPVELLNGAAADGLRALEASVSIAEAVASERGINLSAVQALWERAGSRLRSVPESGAVVAAAADAAVLLYTAAWMLDSDSVTTEGLLSLL